MTIRKVLSSAFKVFADNRRVSGIVSLTRSLMTLSLIYSIVVFTLAVSSPAQKKAIAKPQTQTLQGDEQISTDAALQIQSLVDEKNARTPAQQKIDSQLLYATKMKRNEAITSLVPTLDVNVGADQNGEVEVDLSAIIDNDLISKLKGMGAEIENLHPEYHALRVKTSLENLETIAGFSQVKFIGQKKQARTFRANNPQTKLFNQGAAASGINGRIQNIISGLSQFGIDSGNTNFIPNGHDPVGSATAEAVTIHGVYSARGTFNTDGTGIRIGVLSDSVTTAALAASQASGDLPPTCSSLTPAVTEHCVNIVPGQGNEATAGDEGTAMMEVVHDIAPGAQLYFATAFTSIEDFATNIKTLRNTYHCDVIVDDVGYFVEAPFQDGQGAAVVSTDNAGIVTQAVNEVTANGAMYFSAASNSGNKNDATATSWEGNFVDGGTSTLAALSAGTVNNFNPSGTATAYNLIPNASTTGVIGLSWADPLGASTNDYDVFLLNNAGTAVNSSSTNIQNGTQDPYEEINPASLTAARRAVILKKTGAANRFLHLSTNGYAAMTFTTNGETHGHAAASGGYGVAAAPAFTPFSFPVGATTYYGPYPNLYSSTDKVETFSSDGPRKVFFNGDGTAITPGDFSSTGGTTLQQPVLTAADGQQVTGNGGFGSPFYGTSCAAPTAAAIAGLIKSANPSLTPAQIRTALTTTAIDIETAGTDQNAGYGVAAPYPAMQAAGIAGKAFVEFNSSTLTETFGNSNGLVEPGESGTISVNLKNTGLANATGVTATLTTTTPNVTITPNTSAYADLAASGGSGNNNTSFVVNLDKSVPSDQTLSFALTLNYTGGWNAAQTVYFNVPAGSSDAVAAPSAQGINFTQTTGRQIMSTTLDATAPTTSTSFPVATTGSQTGRLNFTGTAAAASTCAAPKTAPARTTTGARLYDAYTITNPTSSSVCASVTLTVGKQTNDYLQVSAYAGSYVPTNQQTNYLADIGAPSVDVPNTMSFTVAANQTVVIVVNYRTAALTGAPYTLKVSGIPSVAPTAAAVSVTGKLTANGRSVANSKVQMVNERGEVKTVLSNSFGYFRFDDVQAGKTYVFQVNDRRYKFAPQAVTINDNLTNLNFEAQPSDTHD